MILFGQANGGDFHVHMAVVFLGFNKTSKHCTWMSWGKRKFPALMVQTKALNHLLTLLLFLSFILSLDAAPLSRSLGLRNQGVTAIKAAEQVINKAMLFEEGVPVNGRMGIELNDYPGSGANSRHDPKNPGKP
ncbi:hypothetical protein OPV22_017052 [Ensete ventricosum]|uniref:Uncharacterized protein n=1 Tax=Ensete ventricosum TaxID=4639 RepID=A0AAV8QX44_ENSVE|nr:hypothetical protein OPV22_017052 [Ensete ventricosum]